MSLAVLLSEFVIGFGAWQHNLIVMGIGIGLALLNLGYEIGKMK